MSASKRIETERKREGIQTRREETNPKFRGENLKWATAIFRGKGWGNF